MPHILERARGSVLTVEMTEQPEGYDENDDSRYYSTAELPGNQSGKTTSRRAFHISIPSLVAYDSIQLRNGCGIVVRRKPGAMPGCAHRVQNSSWKHCRQGNRDAI